MEKRTVTFYFEGRPLRGVEGESVARALFAAGIRTLSHSVKYKRPRGLFCARGRCVACHMSVDGVPGVPTCVTPLRAGMEIERERYEPFYGEILTGVARAIPFPAGFYYRMFTRPAVVRRLFLGTLRRMAGVGRIVPDRASPHAAGPKPGTARMAPRPRPAIESSYDLAVVGCGLSGMAAALSAAHHGLHVLLVDEYDFPAGHSFGYQPDAELAEARDALVHKIERHVAVTYLPATTAQGFYPPDTLLLGPGPSAGLRTGEAMKRVRARSFVFAAGANDAIPLFENNDTPGIFGERATRLLLERDDLRPGRRAVVYGTGPALRATGQLLLHHDIKLAALVDPTEAARTDEHNRRVLDKIRTITSARIARASGGAWIRGVDVATQGGGKTAVECDLLCVALPGQPSYELAYQAGVPYALSDAALDEFRVMLPTRRPSQDRGTVPVFVAGEAAGETDWKRKIEDGTRAGADAAGALRA
jgi:sarcosine oxidase subunit alpha